MPFYELVVLGCSIREHLLSHADTDDVRHLLACEIAQTIASNAWPNIVSKEPFFDTWQQHNQALTHTLLEFVSAIKTTVRLTTGYTFPEHASAQDVIDYLERHDVPGISKEFFLTSLPQQQQALEAHQHALIEHCRRRSVYRMFLERSYHLAMPRSHYEASQGNSVLDPLLTLGIPLDLYRIDPTHTNKLCKLVGKSVFNQSPVRVLWHDDNTFQLLQPQNPTLQSTTTLTHTVLHPALPITAQHAAVQSQQQHHDDKTSTP